MPVLDIFSESVKYKYKTNVCSVGTLLVFFATIITLSVPIIIIHLTGGFWIKNDVYTEIPKIMFKQKYLLLAESREGIEPITCSTFNTYKENRISDSCTVTKVQELDVNRDGLNDVLKFELRFFTEFPVQNIRLLLFFNYELKGKSKLSMETMAALHYTIPSNVQKILILGDLKLKQKHLLQNDVINNVYDHSTDINNQSLFQLLSDAVNRKFGVKIENDGMTWESGFSAEEETVVQLELFYQEEVVHSRPGVWEELKWAWIQYFAFFFSFAYIAKQVTGWIFVNRYVRSYVISPWEEK
ncbi:transmembrane protein 231 [Athalia rosae]|uniref:transmembrane protein 231 n=1 Tax=Athalia rosae TaxID=37344 RepID=UPI0020338DEF|nr:transmembrane protein 231 [Athalia rosae]